MLAVCVCVRLSHWLKIIYLFTNLGGGEWRRNSRESAGVVTTRQCQCGCELTERSGHIIASARQRCPSAVRRWTIRVQVPHDAVRLSIDYARLSRLSTLRVYDGTTASLVSGTTSSTQDTQPSAYHWTTASPRHWCLELHRASRTHRRRRTTEPLRHRVTGVWNYIEHPGHRDHWTTASRCHCVTDVWSQTESSVYAESVRRHHACS